MQGSERFSDGQGARVRGEQVMHVLTVGAELRGAGWAAGTGVVWDTGISSDAGKGLTGGARRGTTVQPFSSRPLLLGVLRHPSYSLF